MSKRMPNKQYIKLLHEWIRRLDFEIECRDEYNTHLNKWFNRYQKWYNNYVKAHT